MRANFNLWGGELRIPLFFCSFLGSDTMIRMGGVDRGFDSRTSSFSSRWGGEKFGDFKPFCLHLGDLETAWMGHLHWRRVLLAGMQCNLRASALFPANLDTKRGRQPKKQEF